MAKTKIEKIERIQEEIRQLKERQKLLQQQHNAQERKDRTRRLCRRMGLFECMLPDTISLTDEQFKLFLEKVITSEQSRRILKELNAPNDKNAAREPGMTAAQSNGSPTAQAIQRMQGSGTAGAGDWAVVKK